MARGNEGGWMGRTFPTKSCVRVSRGGLLVRADEPLDAMAIWMTASMSSLVGPEPAGGDPGAELVFAWPAEAEAE